MNNTIKKTTTAIVLSLASIFVLSTNASADYYLDQDKVTQELNNMTGEGMAKSVLQDAYIKNYAFVSAIAVDKKYANRFGISSVHKINFKTKFLGTAKFMHFAVEFPENSSSKDKDWVLKNAAVKVLQFQDTYSTQFPPGHFTH